MMFLRLAHNDVLTLLPTIKYFKQWYIMKTVYKYKAYESNF